MDVWRQNTQLQQAKSYEFHKVITYSHIKDAAGIRHGMNIHLAFLTGAGDVEPVQGGSVSHDCTRISLIQSPAS